jgi:methyltransferase (TIGR00027 family)
VVLQRASQTAISAAVHRAAHQVFDSDPKILEDPIAVGLVPETAESVLRSDASRFDRPIERRLRANFVLRSRFAEDQLEDAANRGVRQYVILGAGLDTFAYRRRNWVESRCGAVAVGRTYLFPPLSAGGASLVQP